MAWEDGALGRIKRVAYDYLGAFDGPISTTSTLAVTGTTTLTGAATMTGGITPASAPTGVPNWINPTATSGTDTAFADGTQFVTSIWLPVNMTLTGFTYLIGTVGGTDKVYVVLYSSAGAVLANSSLTGGGATVGTAAQTQAVAFTATYAAVGNRRYYVGVSANGATAKLRTVPAFCSGGLFAGSVAQTHGTVAAITAPTTFTADKAPIGFLY